MWSIFSRFLTTAQRQLEADHGDDDQASVHETADAFVPEVPLDKTPVDDPVLVVTPDGWIEPRPGSSIKIERIPTKRIQKLATPRGEPHGIEWHWTATPAGSIRNAAKRITELPRTLKDGTKERAASFHLGIPQSGAMIQLASVEVGTWHSGGASAARFDVDVHPSRKYVGVNYSIYPNGRMSANAIFVGVELENVGEVQLVKGKWRSWPFQEGEGHVIKEENTVTAHDGAKLRRYERFTEHQIHLATEFVRAMAIAYPRSITRASCSWGHVLIDPTRKTDPGPYWMAVVLPRILDEVFP